MFDNTVCILLQDYFFRESDQIIQRRRLLHECSHNLREELNLDSLLYTGVIPGCNWKRTQQKNFLYPVPRINVRTYGRIHNELLANIT